MQCPAVEALVTASEEKDKDKTEEPQILTGAQFVDRNLGVRNVVVYPVINPVYELQDSPEFDAVLKQPGLEDVVVWPESGKKS